MSVGELFKPENRIKIRQLSVLGLFILAWLSSCSSQNGVETHVVINACKEVDGEVGCGLEDIPIVGLKLDVEGTPIETNDSGQATADVNINDGDLSIDGLQKVISGSQTNPPGPDLCANEDTSNIIIKTTTDGDTVSIEEAEFALTYSFCLEKTPVPPGPSPESIIAAFKAINWLKSGL